MTCDSGARHSSHHIHAECAEQSAFRDSGAEKCGGARSPLSLSGNRQGDCATFACGPGEIRPDEYRHCCGRCRQIAAVYQAIRRTKGKELCSGCGHVVREGFEVDHSVLKDGWLYDVLLD